MTFVKKLGLLPFLIVFACLIAGLYGALHNQISYTVSGEYFTKFKFNQFRIENMSPRAGAAWVGWQASWWMGFFIGTPIALIGLFAAPTAKDYVMLYIKAALYVVGFTLLVGLLALAWGFITLSPETLPSWSRRPNVKNALAFARAGTMHNFSYLGGLIGVLFGSIYMLVKCLKIRRRS